MSPNDDSPAAAPRYSVAFPRHFWYPACRSADLGSKPHPFSLMDTPLVAFRDAAGDARVLVDRCPHRNVPLSLGRVRDDGCIECGYHGWQFDGEGNCAVVPGLRESARSGARARSVPAHATHESDGFVWIWGEPDAKPTGEPFALPDLELPDGDGGRTQARLGVGEVVLAYDIDSTVHAAAENALDVPHTAFLHRGLFRGATPQNEITAERRAIDGGVEVQYLGEPIGMGPFRLPAGDASTFDHWDRFFLPSIAQIEYRVPGWFHIVNTIPHLPLSPLRTRCWFVVRFWTPLPEFAVRPIIAARGRQIARQDVEMLRSQTRNAQRFGGERYASTELDLMGPVIWKLLRRAERAEAGEKEAALRLSKKVTFRA